MYHVPRAITTVFLILLIMNFLSVTVPSFLPLVTCPYHMRITNIVWGSKQSGFIVWRIGGSDISIQMEFFYGRMGVCGLGSIICVLLSMIKDKKYRHHNVLGIQYIDYFLYYPSLKCLVEEFISYTGVQKSTQKRLFLNILNPNYYINWGGWYDIMTC